MTLRRFSQPIGFIILIAALTADRLFKYSVQHRFLHGATETTLGPFYVGYYPNPGIGFGIQLPNWLTVGLVGLIIISLVAWLLLRSRLVMPLLRWAAGFILIGAASNLYDRVRYEYVVDVFDFNRWSVFNFADIWIVIGVVIFVFDAWNKKSLPAPNSL